MTSVSPQNLAAFHRRSADLLEASHPHLAPPLIDMPPLRRGANLDHTLCPRRFVFSAAVQLRFISLAMNFEASTWFTVDTAHSQNRYRPIERCLVASGKVLHSAPL
jgi:hypothetical protein